jgi:hypothetical protein
MIFPVSSQEFTSSHLPIVIISTNGTIIRDEPKKLVHMGIINNPQGINQLTDPFTDYDGYIGIEYRGHSTQLFEKKSYSIETWDENGLDIDVSLLGLPEEEDWILYGSPIDKTHIRNVMSFEIWQKMGYWVPNTRYLELVIDGEYQGLYILIEKVKKDSNRLDIATLTEFDVEGDELTGGYIIKMDWVEGDGWWSTYNSMGGNPLYFQYHYPKAENIQPAQKLYIRQFINDFEEAVFGNDFRNHNGTRYSSLIDINSFADLFIINELSRSVDAYKASTFIHKEKNSDGGLLKAGPIWDFNLAYGNVVYCGGSRHRGWTYLQLDNECDDLDLMPLWWNRMMSDYLFKETVHCRWQSYRNDFLTEQFLYDFIDQKIENMGEALDRNFKKWNYLGINLWDEPEPIPDTYIGEIQRLKSWLTNRIEWLDEEFKGECPVTGINKLDTIIEIYPNPTKSTIKISFKGIKNVDFLITDLFGRIIMKIDKANDQIILEDFGLLPDGIYIIQLLKDDYLHREIVIKN